MSCGRIAIDFEGLLGILDGSRDRIGTEISASAVGVSSFLDVGFDSSFGESFGMAELDSGPFVSLFTMFISAAISSSGMSPLGSGSFIPCGSSSVTSGSRNGLLLESRFPSRGLPESVEAFGLILESASSGIEENDHIVWRIMIRSYALGRSHQLVQCCFQRRSTSAPQKFCLVLAGGCLCSGPYYAREVRDPLKSSVEIGFQ